MTPSHALEVLGLSLLAGLAIPAGGLLAKVEHIQPRWLERELRHTVIAFAETQFGADYGRLRDFKRKFLAQLSDVLHVYPKARLSERASGLQLSPSPTHLPRR